MEAPDSASRQPLDRDIPQPPSPTLMPFPSACSTPVSSSDLIAMENLRERASAGRGGDRPGRYGFYGDVDPRSAALAASQAAMEEGQAGSLPASRATFSVEPSPHDAEELQDIPLIHVDWPSSAEQASATSGCSDALHTPRRSAERPRNGYPTPEPPVPPYSNSKRQKVAGILSAPKKSHCCARCCPKPFTIIVASLVIALVLIIGFMIGHFAAPYMQTMTFMQPVGALAPGMAPHAGLAAGDGRGIEGAGLGLETDQIITRDHSPTSMTNPYLNSTRKGSGSPPLLTFAPGGV